MRDESRGLPPPLQWEPGWFVLVYSAEAMRRMVETVIQKTFDFTYLCNPQFSLCSWVNSLIIPYGCQMWLGLNECPKGWATERFDSAQLTGLTPSPTYGIVVGGGSQFGCHSVHRTMALPFPFPILTTMSPANSKYAKGVMPYSFTVAVPEKILGNFALPWAYFEIRSCSRPVRVMWTRYSCEPNIKAKVGKARNWLKPDAREKREGNYRFSKSEPLMLNLLPV